MDFKDMDGMVWTGLIWLSIGVDDGVFVSIAVNLQFP
jgi:hypothetical protein